MRDLRIVVGRLLAFGATFALGGWAVAASQAFLTYNRLMVLTAARSATPLESALLFSGFAFALLWLGGRLILHSAPATPTRRATLVTTRLSAATLISAGWYASAVAQWHLVIRQASTDPTYFRRDPTILEHFLVTSAGISLAALALHSTTGWLRSRARPSVERD